MCDAERTGRNAFRQRDVLRSCKAPMDSESESVAEAA
jgi:hypothetical protein